MTGINVGFALCGSFCTFRRVIPEIRRLTEAGFSVGNVDVTIVAQAPKLAPFIPAMGESLARALSLPPEWVNVKATTTERLGFEGRGEGISAQAVCLLTQRS